LTSGGVLLKEDGWNKINKQQRKEEKKKRLNSVGKQTKPPNKEEQNR